MPSPRARNYTVRRIEPNRSVTVRVLLAERSGSAADFVREIAYARESRVFVFRRRGVAFDESHFYEMDTHRRLIRRFDASASVTTNFRGLTDDGGIHFPPCVIRGT